MLAWERAPVLPISRWFEPELVLPAPDKLTDEELRELLIGDAGAALRPADRAGFHGASERPAALHADHPRHSALAREEDRPAAELSALALPGHGRRAGGLADDITPARRSASVGRRDGPAVAAAHEPPHPRKMPRRPKAVVGLVLADAGGVSFRRMCTRPSCCDIDRPAMSGGLRKPRSHAWGIDNAIGVVKTVLTTETQYQLRTSQPVQPRRLASPARSGSSTVQQPVAESRRPPHLR